MTPAELLKENAQLREQLATAIARGEEALNLAVETSVQYEQAVNTVTALAGAAVAQKDAAPPVKPAPAPPPVPEPPPPLAPASFNEFLALPSTKKAELRAHFGDDLEERLFNEKMLNIRMGLARGGASSAINPSSGGAGHIEPAYRAEDFRTPLQISKAHAEKTAAAIAAGRDGASELDRARVASMNAGMGVGWGVGAVDKTGKAPAPKPAPSGTAVPGQKTRHVAGGGGFAVRSK
jgi:hypothetical protein